MATKLSYIISHFMEVIGANYYIGGLYAFNHYSLTAQLANEITIYNDRLSVKKKRESISPVNKNCCI